MLSLKAKRLGLRMMLGAAVLGVGFAGAMSAPAKADGWHHDHDRGWAHGWYGPRFGLGFGVYPPAYYYPPRPRVYYPPAPVYYPPAYYAPAYGPAYGGLNVTIPIR